MSLTNYNSEFGQIGRKKGSVESNGVLTKMYEKAPHTIPHLSKIKNPHL